MYARISMCRKTRDGAHPRTRRSSLRLHPSWFEPARRRARATAQRGAGASKGAGRVVVCTRPCATGAGAGEFVAINGRPELEIGVPFPLKRIAARHGAVASSAGARAPLTGGCADPPRPASPRRNSVPALPEHPEPGHDFSVRYAEAGASPGGRAHPRKDPQHRTCGQLAPPLHHRIVSKRASRHETPMAP
jgi:hypothetical protein